MNLCHFTGPFLSQQDHPSPPSRRLPSLMTLGLPLRGPVLLKSRGFSRLHHPLKLRPASSESLRQFSKSSPEASQCRVVQRVREDVEDEVEELCAKPFSARTVLDLITHQKWNLLLGAACATYCTMSNLAAPVLSGILFEILINGRGVQEYSKVLLLFAVGYLTEPIVSQVYMRSVLTVGEKTLASMRKLIFRVILRQEIDFFDRHRTAELTDTMAIEINALRSFLVANITRDRGVRALMEASGSVIVLCCLSLQLGPLLAGVIISTAVSATLYRRVTKELEAKQSRGLSDMAEVAEQAIGNIRTVKSFGAEEVETYRLDCAVKDSLVNGLHFGRAKARLEGSNRLAIHLSLLALFGVGGHLVRQSNLPYGVLVTCIGFTYSLVYSSQGLVSTLTDLRKASSAFQRILRVMKQTNVVDKLPSPAVNGQVKIPWAYEEAKEGDIEFRDVGFAYSLRPNTQVLKGLSLTLKQGTVTAIVGETGGGKSTISYLLSKFYEPHSGGIYLNGILLNKFDKSEWVDAVALVSQDPVLFQGSIFENICYGKNQGCDLTGVETAAKAANIHDFIMSLPDNYNTMVGERGVLLSGGERQRITIARALVKDSPILVLDEATSSLDVRSEAIVQQALKRLMKGRTVLIIAHRLSTIRTADKIAVIGNGAVLESGSHDELMKMEGHYARLVRTPSSLLP